MNRQEIEHLIYIILLIGAIILLIVNLYNYTKCGLAFAEWAKGNMTQCELCRTLESIGMIQSSRPI